MRSAPCRTAAVLLAASLPVTARAAGPAARPATTGPSVVWLTLHPVAVADPPLRYQLLPPLADQHPGDAAYEYELASRRMPPYEAAAKGDDFYDRVYGLIEAPPAVFAPAAADELLKRVPSDLIDAAARCERAHWATGLREHGVDTLLPYLNDLRSLADMASLRARAAVARGDFPAATTAMQTNLAMVRQLHDRPLLVQALVAAGIAGLTLDRCVEPWVSRAGAPNLYWSLSGLPASFTDLYAVAEAERGGWRFTDGPWIALAADDRLPADQWPRVTTSFARIARLFSLPISPPAGSRATVAAADVAADRQRLVTKLEPAARDHWRAAGRPAAVVAAMSADEAVGRYLLWQAGPMLDPLWAAWPLPFPQAAGPLRRADAAIRQTGAADDNLLVVKLYAARHALARADEHLAALRVIEALRDHAARHGGRPPAALDDIADLPIPPDPVTGRPFVYHADGSAATLTLPAPPDVSPHRGFRFELTFVTP